MLEGGKITAKQIILLLFTARVITTIAVLLILSAPPGNQDIWIDCLMGFPVQLLVALPFYFLAKRFPKQTFFEYAGTILGMTGKLIGILYVFFFIHMSALSINHFSDFLTTALMIMTPSLFFRISLLFLAAYAAYKGVENLGRLSEFVAPIIIIAVLVVVSSLVKDMDPKEFQPFLESGVFPSFLTGLYGVSTNIEIIIMAIILPFLNDRSKLKTVYIIFPLILVIFSFMLASTVIAIFGYDLAIIMTYPFFSAIRVIQLGSFLERVESIHIAIWILGAFVKMALYLYVMALGISQVFHLKAYQPLLLPLASIIVSVSTMLSKNVVETKAFSSFPIYSSYTLIFIFIIPFFLLLIAIVRKQGEYTP